MPQARHNLPLELTSFVGRERELAVVTHLVREHRRLAKLKAERRKLLEAYYAGAVDIALLRSEQERLSRDAREAEERLAGVEATLSEWQEVLGIALKFASNCAQAYRSANDRIRRLYNSAVFDELVVRGGEIVDVHYGPPFALVFGVTEFEQGGMELLISHNPNRMPSLAGSPIRLGGSGNMGSRRRS